MPLSINRAALPLLASQLTIVSELDAEHALLAANRVLIIRIEAKIQATLTRVWEDDAD